MGIASLHPSYALCNSDAAAQPAKIRNSKETLD
jgi:hypothetical protein